MAQGRISKSSVDALPVGAKDQFFWDSELPGFGVKVTPAGRKTYVVQFRLGGRKCTARRMTIGAHGRITPQEARTEAKSLLGKVALGRDPAEEKNVARGQNCLGDTLNYFLTTHVDAKLKPTTAREYRRLLSIHLPAGLKKRGISNVNRADITTLHHSLRETPYQANRLLAVLSKFFSWCESQGIRPDYSNPCNKVQKYREEARQRFLSDTEIARLSRELSAAEQDESASPWSLAAIRLYLLTGARLNEILKLRWSEVDLERRQLRLGDSKTGGKPIHLSDLAIDVLLRIPRLEGNPHVICGQKEGAHLVNIQKTWRRIRRNAGLDDVRIHDFRHTFASVAAASGLSLPIIGGLLGHSQAQTTQRYAHLANGTLQEAVDLIGLRLEENSPK